MRNNSTLAIWLALIMLLLVGAAAVFFLVQRNTELEGDTQQAAAEAAAAQTAAVAAAATRERLQSDMAIRQAALSSLAATRDTLAAEAELNAGRAQELESALAEQKGDLAQAQATLQALAIQVTIIAPADGATIPPLQEIDILATIRSDAELELVTLSIDDQQIARVPAEGQQTINIRAGWSPPDEGAYVIEAEARTIEGRSETATITVDAAFASDEAREIALRAQVEAATLAQRFPTPEAPVETAVAAEAALPEPDYAPLHRLLLTGRAVDDEESAANDAFVLQSLDLIASEAGYQSYLDEVVEADLLTYYDPDTGTLITYQAADQTGPFGRWLGVHDLAHQWQAERFGLDALDLAAMNGDRRLATRALVEGDAVFLQHRLLADETIPASQAEEIQSALEAAATELTADAPDPLRAAFEFAYSQGVPFVRALYDQGGFALVDGAWRQLPASSEQILHPERYLALDMPVTVNLVPLAAALGPGWRLVNDDTFGEFLLRQHLGRQPLTAQQIDLAATGWGGGRYAVYQAEAGDLPLVVIRLAWDAEEDAGEFAEVYAEYLVLRFGDEVSSIDGDGRCWQGAGVGCLFQDGDDSLVIWAPDLDLALAAAAPQLIMSQP